ncbi:MAG: RNA degradosome polyphosphate kinase, partial [Pirellula sp.]
MPHRDRSFINRELSWLEFNQRVLDQALYSKVPVLDRLKFLAITASNMDEFFMVRVGGLQLQQSQGVETPDPSGLSVSEQLEQIFERVNSIIRDQYDCFLNAVEPILTSEGLERISAKNASARHTEAMRRFFSEEIYPILSPMDIDPDRHFPILTNLGIHLCVRMASGDSEKP